MRVYEFIDKSEWGDGPWQEEPDRAEWIDEASDLDCMVRRHPRSGNWCGYVAVPPGHPLHGIDYGDERAEALEVHGGLTFASACDEEHAGNPNAVCHVPEPGRPGDVWWFGFDCAHGFDLLPGRSAYEARLFGWPYPRTPYESTYRTLAYVRGEVERLAAQLVAS